jgi:hypothetical protein
MHCSFNDGRCIVELMMGDALLSCCWENALLGIDFLVNIFDFKD